MANIYFIDSISKSVSGVAIRKGLQIIFCLMSGIIFNKKEDLLNFGYDGKGKKIKPLVFFEEELFLQSLFKMEKAYFSNN